MVIVSALSFTASQQSGKSYLPYLWDRIKRLAFPVWIFLTFYFFTLLFLEPNHADLDPTTIQDSYLLQSGIGFVWIIRVFLLVAITAPITYKVYNKVKNKYFYFGLLFFMYLLQELALLGANYSSVDIEKDIWASILLYIIPFTMVFAYGLHMPHMSTSDHKLAFLFGLFVFLALFAILFVTRSEIVPTQDFKYPPQAYYLAFSLIGMEFLWLIMSSIIKLISKIRIMSCINFIGQNSLWIYLWHIPFVKFIDTNFIIEYAISFSGAVLITFLQVTIIKIFVMPHINSAKVKRNLKMILTG